jgi:hypothetical protein
VDVRPSGLAGAKARTTSGSSTVRGHFRQATTAEGASVIKMSYGRAAPQIIY